MPKVSQQRPFRGEGPTQQAEQSHWFNHVGRGFLLFRVLLVLFRQAVGKEAGELRIAD
jgi:hypothetical protein